VSGHHPADRHLSSTPVAEGINEIVTQPENAILRTLALPNEQPGRREVNVHPFKSGCLCQSQSGVKHEQEKQPIALDCRVSWIRLSKQRLLLFLG